MILRRLRTHLSGFPYVGGRKALIQFGLNLRDALKLDFKVLCLRRSQVFDALQALRELG